MFLFTSLHKLNIGISGKDWRSDWIRIWIILLDYLSKLSIINSLVSFCSPHASNLRHEQCNIKRGHRQNRSYPRSNSYDAKSLVDRSVLGGVQRACPGNSGGGGLVVRVSVEHARTTGSIARAEWVGDGEPSEWGEEGDENWFSAWGRGLSSISM